MRESGLRTPTNVNPENGSYTRYFAARSKCGSLWNLELDIIKIKWGALSPLSKSLPESGPAKLGAGFPLSLSLSLKRFIADFGLFYIMARF